MQAFKDDTTKPSRVNRRRKRKWKKSASLQHCLTIFKNTTNLNPLSVGQLSGIRTPFNQGLKMTAPFAVFFRLSFRTALIRFYSVMAGLFGQPHGWPLLDAVVRTHSNPSPKSFEPLSVGLSILLSRITAMINNSNRASSAQNPSKTPIFNLYHTRRPIAQGIDGALAIRYKRRFSGSIIKFAGWGVL
jgi:hypothetical protein